MTNLPALYRLTLNRVLVMLREPEVLFWIFLFPVILAMGIGVAFSDANPEGLRVAVERGSPAEEFVTALGAGGDLEAFLVAPDERERALRRGEAAVLVVGSAGSDGGVTLLYDPTRPEAHTARVLTELRLQQAAGGTRPLMVNDQEVRVPGQRYVDWLIPGLIGFNLMGTGMWSVAFYTTQARETRELRRLVATPMRRSDFLLSQILARFVFLVGEIPLIIFFGWLIFSVSVEGSLVWLAVVVLTGAACFTALGLLAAARTRTTEGVSGVINLVMLPMLVLSGVFFSTERFPDAAQPFIQILPLTALNDALRAIYNEGLGLSSVLGELGIIGLWTLASVALALRLFRWQ